MSEKKTPAIRFKGFTNGWNHRKLGDIGETFNGLSGKSKVDFGHGKGKFVTYMNVFLNAISDLNMLGQTEIDSKQDAVKYGDIFFTTSSETPDEVGMSSVWLGNKENIYLNSFCFGYRPFEQLDPYYMAFMLRSDIIREKIVYLAQGISRYNISKKGMMEIEVPIPSLTEQGKIGEYLNNIDHIITIHQRKLTKLQLLKKSMLTKMFPKDGARVPEIRFQGFHGDWKLYTLNELAVFGGGHTPSMADEANYKKDGICWVTSQDVKTDYLFDTRTKLSDKGASELKLYPDGTIIMVTRSGILRHTLPIALLKIPATVNQDIRTISVGLSCSSTWLMQYLKVHERELLLNYGKVGTTVESIDFSKLKTMNLLVPTMDEQEKIGAYFSKMDNLIAIRQHNITKWQHIKQAMLSKLFV